MAPCHVYFKVITTSVEKTDPDTNEVVVEEVPTYFYTCLLCTGTPKPVSAKNTTNLWTHLERHHESVFAKHKKPSSRQRSTPTIPTAVGTQSGLELSCSSEEPPVNYYFLDLKVYNVIQKDLLF
jgi:hypothetical protein